MTSHLIPVGNLPPDDYGKSHTCIDLIDIAWHRGTISAHAERTGVASRPDGTQRPVYSFRRSGTEKSEPGSWVYEAGRFHEARAWHQAAAEGGAR